MSDDSDRRGRRTAAAACTLLLIPVACCGVPLLVASGALAGVGSWLHSVWLLGAAAVVLAIAAFVLRGRRR